MAGGRGAGRADGEGAQPVVQVRAELPGGTVYVSTLIAPPTGTTAPTGGGSRSPTGEIAAPDE